MNDEPPLFSGVLADVVARYPYNACAYSRALADRSAPFPQRAGILYRSRSRSTI